MAEAAKQDATYQDILALPPHVTGQIVFRVLHAHPRPTHAQAASTLGEEVGLLRFWGPLPDLSSGTRRPVPPTRAHKACWQRL